MATITMLLVLLLLSVGGVPFVWATLGAGLIGLFLLPGVPLELAAEQLFAGFDTFVLAAIPLFMLAGDILRRGAVVDEVVAAVLPRESSSLRPLALANVGSSLLFSGINGSALADTSAIGGVLIPAMTRAGFKPEYAVALTAAGSVVGPVVPPSIVFLYYGAVTQTSVAALFVAGVIPGVMISAFLAVYVWWHDSPSRIGASTGGTYRDRLPSVSRWRLALYALGPPLVVVGIAGGIVSPVEASVLAVGFSLVCVAARAWGGVGKLFVQSLGSAGSMAGEILLLIGFSKLLGWVIVVDGGSGWLTSMISGADKTVVLLVVNVWLLILGAFVDTFPAIAVTVPMLLPVAANLGIDPVHLGVIVVVNLMIGGLVPPIGECLLLASNIGGVKYRDAVVAALPMILVLLAALTVITFVPELSTWLPSLVWGSKPA
ncbi:MAG: TRAP transporter large permease [Acidobacteria bacterium]|nr:TRAP transporter large permease [Acidobacteriota bacterium]